MFWSIRALIFGWFIAGGILLLYGTTWGEASSPVTVQIPDVCRYRIENIGIVPQKDFNLAVETVNIKILSNSDRTWQLLVSCKDISNPIEWSADGTIWQNLGTQPIIVLTGNRSFWKNYSLIYRYRNPLTTEGVGFQYQIVFQDW